MKRPSALSQSFAVILLMTKEYDLSIWKSRRLLNSTERQLQNSILVKTVLDSL